MASLKYMMIFILMLTAICINSCNPVSEKINEQQWNSLHNSKPFQSDFFHSSSYRNPHGSCDQVQCHGASLTGGNSGAPSCFACHTDQWSVFGNTHTLNISGWYHHSGTDTGYSNTGNALWFNTCKSCHGTNLDGAGSSAVYSCKVCHSGFTKPVPPPGHRILKNDGGQTGWHYYSYVGTDPGAGSGNPNNNCTGTACHGTYGSSAGSAVDGSGGIVAAHGRSCGDCH